MIKISIKKQLSLFELDVDVTINNRGVTAIFGRSGSGKSTLINIISGLVQADKGHVYVDDKCLFDTDKKIILPVQKRNIGYVFQEALLFPHYTVKNNLTYGYKKQSTKHFDETVELLGITSLLHRYPATLSGGEKQRVAIGRALLSNPKLLLMDEPLSALDTPKKQEVLPFLAKLTKDIKLPILYVSHHLDEIATLAEKIIVLEQGKRIAHHTLDHIWQNGVLKEWQHIDSPVNFIKLTQSIDNRNENAITFFIGSQPFIHPITSQTFCPTSAKYLKVNYSDITLSTSRFPPSSNINTLKATILGFEKENTNMDIKLSVGNQIIWSRLPYFIFDNLALAINQNVFIQINHWQIN